MLNLYNIMPNYFVSHSNLHLLNTFAEINSQSPLRAKLELNKCKGSTVLTKEPKSKVM